MKNINIGIIITHHYLDWVESPSELLKKSVIIYNREKLPLGNTCLD
jgi:hypothetical protein